MKKYNVWLALLAASIFSLAGVHAQEITNITPQLEGKDIVITYDLVGNSMGAKCEVLFYFGDDTGQENLLKDATGDFGEGVEIGTGKTVRIANLEPFMRYMKSLTFRAVASYTYVPITELTLLTDTKVKIKGTIPLTWRGGVQDAPITLSLLQDGQLLNEAIEVKNSNRYDFELPKNAIKGMGYKIVVADDAGKELNTGVFSVKPKSKALLVIAGVAVVGGLVFVLLNGGGDGDTPIIDEVIGVPDLPEGAHPVGG